MAFTADDANQVRLTTERADMKRMYKRAFEAGILTFGLAACVAALAAGHADDAPGVGLIGLGIFFACAFAAFFSASETRRE